MQDQGRIWEGGRVERRLSEIEEVGRRGKVAAHPGYSLHTTVHAFSISSLQHFPKQCMF